MRLTDRRRWLTPTLTVLLLGGLVVFAQWLLQVNTEKGRFPRRYLNLDRIGVALRQYVAENEGFFPFDLRGQDHGLYLLREYLRESAFQVPGIDREGRAEPRWNHDGERLEGSDYWYLNPASAKEELDALELILGESREAIAKGSRWFVNVEGHLVPVDGER